MNNVVEENIELVRFKEKYLFHIGLCKNNHNLIIFSKHTMSGAFCQQIARYISQR